MNLYRSFGNLMEAWMVEGAQVSYSEAVAESQDEDPETPSSHVEAQQRWESLDSGVETSGSDVSPASPGDNTEPLGGCCPAPASPSPPLSPGRSHMAPLNLQQRVEQVLQRTSSQHLKEKQEPVTPAAVLRRLSRASPASRRSESFDHGGSEVRLRTGSRLRRRPASMIVDKVSSQRKLEDLSEEEGRELSPGLSYLEQVCRTLEEFARQQMQSQAAAQREGASLREQRYLEFLRQPDTPDWLPSGLRTDQTDQTVSSSGAFQDPDGSLEDWLLPTKDAIVCSGHTLGSDSAQARSSEPQRRKDYRGHFKQRSVSDANLATLHLRELNVASRGQKRFTTDDMLLKLTDDFQNQESKKPEKSKTNSRHWTFKINSLKRESSSQKESKSQQTQPSEKSSTRRRLSQLFRRNQRKTQLV